MKIRNKSWRRELCHVHAVGGIVFAATLAVIQILLWCVVGAPIGIFYLLRGVLPLLPRWLYMLCDLLIHACLGAAFGMVLLDRRGVFEVQKYRGAFYFLLAILMGYLYYAFFFGISFFLVSVVLAGLEFFGILVAALNFTRINRLSVFLLFIGLLWAFYRFFFPSLPFLAYKKTQFS